MILGHFRNSGKPTEIYFMTFSRTFHIDARFPWTVWLPKTKKTAAFWTHKILRFSAIPWLRSPIIRVIHKSYQPFKKIHRNLEYLLLMLQKSGRNPKQPPGIKKKGTLGKKNGKKNRPFPSTGFLFNPENCRVKALGVDPKMTPDARGLDKGIITTWTTRIRPWRLTCNIIMEVWKIIFLSKLAICRFHVNLPGCRFFEETLISNFFTS